MFVAFKYNSIRTTHIATSIVLWPCSVCVGSAGDTQTLSSIFSHSGSCNEIIVAHVFVKCCSWVCIIVRVLPGEELCSLPQCSPASPTVVSFLKTRLPLEPRLLSRDGSSPAISLTFESLVVHSCQTPRGNFVLICIFWVIVLFAIYFSHMQKQIC